MSQRRAALSVVACSLLGVVAGVKAPMSNLDVPDPSRFAPFLTYNKAKGSHMPLSYMLFPTDFFDQVPAGLKSHLFTNDTFTYRCKGSKTAKDGMVPPKAMDLYTFETEKLIASLGLDIYDGAVWSIASSLLDDGASVDFYNENVLLEARTLQLADIKGDKACVGNMYTGKCSDPTQSGACGICYGDEDKTLSKKQALLFRMIADYWAIQGTKDERCPDVPGLWTWNDYKPILGENSWALLTGPLMHAVKKYKDAAAIPDNAVELQLAMNTIDAFEALLVPETDATKPGYGAIYYAPNNVFFYAGSPNPNAGATVSVENQASALASLKGLRYVLAHKPTYAGLRCRVEKLISGLETFLLTAYDASQGYFRQGGSYDAATKTWSWGQAGQPGFAVDCQTWVITALGPKAIDAKLGAKATVKIYDTLKKLAGYGKQADGKVKGFGFTDMPAAWQYTHKAGTYNASATVIVTLAAPLSAFNQSDFTDRVSYVSGTNPAYVHVLEVAAAKTGTQVVLVFLQQGYQKPMKTATKFVMDLANPDTQQHKYVGATNAVFAETFSAEWTFGAVNMLRVAAAEGGYDAATKASLIADADFMRASIEEELLASTPVQQGFTYHPSFLYSNSRFWIPFGWWANPLPSTASTGWAVAVDKGWNPLHILGSYASAYPTVTPAPTPCGNPPPPPSPPTPPLPPPSPLPESLHNILADLYKSAGGAGWFANDYWLDGLHYNPCGTPADPGSQYPYLEPWVGVSCDGNGVLKSLSLPNNNVTGQLPASLTKLDTLVELNLEENRITGVIPENIGDMTALKILHLENNQLGGTVPASITKLADLNFLALGYNKLTGGLPDLSQNKELKVLTASNNQLTTLPASVPYSAYPNCDLSVNPFTCPIPADSKSNCYATCH